MKKEFEFKMTRTYETYMVVVAENDEQAWDILKDSMEEFYALETKQCFVIKEEVEAIQWWYPD
jgi:hypothetical protein